MHIYSLPPYNHGTRRGLVGKPWGICGKKGEARKCLEFLSLGLAKEKLMRNRTDPETCEAITCLLHTESFAMFRRSRCQGDSYMYMEICQNQPQQTLL